MKYTYNNLFSLIFTFTLLFSLIWNTPVAFGEAPSSEEKTTAIEAPKSPWHKQWLSRPLHKLWQPVEAGWSQWLLRPLARPSSEHAWLDPIPANVAPVIAETTNRWLANTYNLAKTTFELSPPLKAHQQNAFHEALEMALINQGFALSQSKQVVASAIPPLRYELPQWENGWMLTLNLLNLEVNRVFNTDGSPRGAVHIKEEPTL